MINNVESDHVMKPLIRRRASASIVDEVAEDIQGSGKPRRAQVTVNTQATMVEVVIRSRL
jgi:hypothetical protein